MADNTDNNMFENVVEKITDAAENVVKQVSNVVPPHSTHPTTPQTSTAGERVQASPVSAAAATQIAYANAGIIALQTWYNSGTGVWDGTGWWNSANALETTIDYARYTGTMTHTDSIANTFNKNAHTNFLNNFYDDEGWWALAWLKAYDLMKDKRYLQMAETIFADMQGGWSDSFCGGGIWWSKERTYKNAIANELFLTTAVRLYQRTNTSSYLDWAKREWNWFLNSGLINPASNLVNDGLDALCENNNGTTWTYNQGVILGALTDLYKATGDSTYLAQAEMMADATILTLVDANGILKEPCEPNCNADGSQFKGIFMRNLGYLCQTDKQPRYRDFILKNVESIWANNRNNNNQFGLLWYGPFDRADASRQSSAMDTIVVAIPLA